MNIRLASYNVHNLFLHGEGEAKSGKALRALVRIITLVEADLWILQEVGSLASLQTLNDKLDNPYAHVALRPGNSNRNIHLGVLSRQPVMLTSHVDQALTDSLGQPLPGYADADAARAGRCTPVALQRDILRVDTHVGPQPLAVFAVHLKSRTQQGWQSVAADDVRAAEVRCLRDLVKQYRQDHPQHWVAIAGDFNDLPSSEPLAALAELGLTDIHGQRFAASGRNPSTYWPKRRARIDRILLCPQAAAQVVAESAQIHIGPLSKLASDHYAISLVLDLPPGTGD